MKIDVIKTDHLCDATDTRPIQSQLGDDNFQHLQNTISVDDTLPLGYEFETQRIDFEDQSHQVFDLSGETQILDECNPEVLVNGGCEGSDKTEVLSDTQILSDDDSVREDASNVVDPGNIVNTVHEKHSDSDAQRTRRGEQFSGSMLGGFTSIRAASIRASGLAARSTSERTKSNQGSTSDNFQRVQNSQKDGVSVNKSSLKLDDGFNLTKGHDDYDIQVNEPSHESAPKVNSSTVIKLFADDMVVYGRQADGSVLSPVRDETLNSFAFENVLGDLSYVNSQEPGELSQANALDAVGKFLELNIVEADEDILFKKSSGKAGAVSRAKGAESLAKKATTKRLESRDGAFKWDDNLEDEGGGEFFKNKKDLFYDNDSQKKKKSRHLNSNSSTCIKKVRKKEKLDCKRHIKTSVQSDPVLLPKSLGRNKLSNLIKTSLKKNLMEDLNEDVRYISSDVRVGNEPEDNLPAIWDVGFDTQLAADAMEDLRFGGGLICNDGADGNEASKKLTDEPDKVPNSVKNHRKRARSSVAPVCKRESKRTRDVVEGHLESSNGSGTPSKNTKKRLGGRPIERKQMRPKLVIEDSGRNRMENLSSVSKLAQPRGSDDVHRTGFFDKPADAAASRNKERRKLVASATLSDEKKLCVSVSDKDHELRNASSTRQAQLRPIIPNYPRRRRTRSQVPLGCQTASTSCPRRSSRSKMDATSISEINATSEQNLPASGARWKSFADGEHSTGIAKDTSQLNTAKHSNENTNLAVNGNLDSSPNNRCKTSISASKTLVICATPVNAASPICKGDEYHKLSCRKSLARSSLLKEVGSLLSINTMMTSPGKDSRRRRGMSSVRVLFSHHLDADIVKQQRKILTRLGASEASSMSDASHFVIDQFVRTQNMLEAIAFGKPVVSHFWLESCEQASCFIDERNYILRDTRKEKEFCFSMPASLAKACQHPLLLGQKVFITPNTKPSKEILMSLVKAVRGLAIEKIERSLLKDKFPDDLLVLSCEDDYDICLPFLEKGAAVYSSELLLNGIVTQRLEYERHRLFTDNVKKIRSTVWLKRENEYGPVVNKGK